MKKTARNDITGDFIHSKPSSDMFEEGWDRIFGKKKFECNTACGHYECNEHQGECKRINKQSRIDTIGSNGNDGLHYDKEWDQMKPVGNEGLHYEYELDKSTGEVIRKETKE